MFVFEFRKVTFAPATTAPDGSLTVPVMSAVACCACAPAASNTMQIARERIHDVNCLGEISPEAHCEVIEGSLKRYASRQRKLTKGQLALRRFMCCWDAILQLSGYRCKPFRWALDNS